MIRSAGYQLLRQPPFSRSNARAQAAGMCHASESSAQQQQQQSPARGAASTALDESLLAMLVCPLAKTLLRYDAQQQLLINDDLGVGYPVVNGVPYLVPTRGKMLHQQQPADSS